MKCEDCHAAKNRHGPAAGLSPRKGGAAGWVGLEQECVSCHEDAHKGSLGKDCTACHDIGKWTFATRFDHAKSDYPLTGKHQDVSCNACHLPKGRPVRRNAKGEPVPIYKPLAHQECSDCHADPHGGRFGTKCTDCHQTTGFKLIRKSGFDHDRTRYPLRGKHGSVACEKCHDPKAPGQFKVAFATCGACHRDAHAGLATLAGKPADCADCHTVNGFDVPAFSVERHARTKYPLEGEHQKVDCLACHRLHPAGVPAAKLGSAGILMRPVFARCRDCHEDDHGGQLARRPGAGACEGCHTPKGWSPSTFTAARHDSLRLTLAGRHGEITCAACHGPDRPKLPALATAGLGKARVALTTLSATCTSCHQDPHAGRYEPGGARPVAGGCEACHDARAFRPSAVDIERHGRLGFALDGAHRAIPCVACHEKMPAKSAASSLTGAAHLAPVALDDPGSKCADCHEDPHGGQFAGRAGGGACETCHATEAFRPASRFDHNRDTRFALRGAHEHVACEACHRPGATVKGAKGPPPLRYRPLSTACESCHAGGKP